MVILITLRSSLWENEHHVLIIFRNLYATVFNLGRFLKCMTNIVNVVFILCHNPNNTENYSKQRWLGWYLHHICDDVGVYYIFELQIIQYIYIYLI